MSEVLLTRTSGGSLVLPGFRPDLAYPSSGAGEDANEIKTFLKNLDHQTDRSESSRSVFIPKTQFSKEKSCAEQLYDALAEAKVMTAQIAMHLDSDWQAELFAELDDLLKLEDWHEDDKPFGGSSFATFLRVILIEKPKCRPGLGVSDLGNLIAAWTNGTARLTLECYPGDMIRWVLSCKIDDEVERAAGETQVRRLPTVLQPFFPDRWFLNANDVPTAR